MLMEEEVDNLVRAARNLHEDEQLRSGAKGTAQMRPAIPTMGTAISDGDLATLKTRFPFLTAFSDSFLRATPLGTLMKMESSQMKRQELEKAKDTEDRLAANSMNLDQDYREVMAGRDNRCSTLHAARFLCGASCSAGQLWMEARKVIGLNGFPPVGTYDMEAVGLAGVVTSKGWAEIHNPASSRLSIKQFNINNCGQRVGVSTGEHDSEITEVAELKLALRAMRTAMAMVMPWNQSIAALEGFMLQSNFRYADIANVEKKAQLLTQFCDYVIGQNSMRWRNGAQFLTCSELKNVWYTFFSARPQAAVSQKQKGGQPPQKKQRTGQADRPAHHSDPAFMALNICFLYNEGRCTKASGSCTTKYGRPLKHICNFVEDATKPSEVCGKDHPRLRNHK